MKQEWKLADRYADYVLKNDLMNQEKKSENDENKLSKPFIFGVTSLEGKKEQVGSNLDNEKAVKTEIQDPRLKPVEKASEKFDPRLKYKETIKNNENGPKEKM